MVMIVLFGLFFLLLFFGMPIAFALAISSMSALVLISGDVFILLTTIQKIFGGVNHFTIMAIPLFILAGNIMTEGKISDKILDFASLFVGRARGGLAHTSTAASTFFGAISGSAPATTAAIGSIMIPNMEKKGYQKQFSASVVAASGMLGLIIPPSITMIMYGVTAGVSIGSLFIAGIVPGLILAVLVMTLNYFLVKNLDIPLEQPKPNKEKVLIIKRSILGLLMPVLILGGIYSGVFTPTESAAVACLYGFIVAFFVYRNMSVKKFNIILKKTTESTAMILFILAMASIFGYVISLEQVPQKLAALLLGFTTNQTLIMLILLAGLLVIGAFLENIAAIVLVVPAISEIISQVGIDPLYFGIFMVITLAVGQITPPIGNNLFVAANIAEVKYESLVKHVTPYICLYVAFLVITIFFPGILTVFVN